MLLIALTNRSLSALWLVSIPLIKIFHELVINTFILCINLDNLLAIALVHGVYVDHRLSLQSHQSFMPLPFLLFGIFECCQGVYIIDKYIMKGARKLCFQYFYAFLNFLNIVLYTLNLGYSMIY